MSDNFASARLYILNKIDIAKTIGDAETFLTEFRAAGWPGVTYQEIESICSAAERWIARRRYRERKIRIE